MDALTWLLENGDTLSGIVTLVVALASAITRLTPTKSDNKVVAAAQAALERFSVLNPRGAERLLKLPAASADRPDDKQETP